MSLFKAPIILPQKQHQVSLLNIKEAVAPFFACLICLIITL